MSSDVRDNDALVGRFRQWLDETRREADALPEDAAEHRDAPPIGLFELVQEFTALRHEVKLQTKSSRDAVERTEQTLAAMQQAAALFRSVEANEKQAGEQAARPIVESLMELDEALARGRTVIDTARRRLLEDLTGHVQQQLDGMLSQMPAWQRWLCSSWCRRTKDLFLERVAVNYRDIFSSLGEGYDLILGRLQRAMKKAELHRIECVGQQVDPALMTVVEVVDDPMRPPGLVVDQVRPGYYWRGKVLRFAEVRAVRS